MPHFLDLCTYDYVSSSAPAELTVSLINNVLFDKVQNELIVLCSSSICNLFCISNVIKLPAALRRIREIALACFYGSFQIKYRIEKTVCGCGSPCEGEGNSNSRMLRYESK